MRERMANVGNHKMFVEERIENVVAKGKRGCEGEIGRVMWGR